MGTYKITNITNLAGKRDLKFNSILDIEYVDNMMKKSISVKPGDSIYLTIASLPLSVHRLRVKNLITVNEVGASELAAMQKVEKPKAVADKPKVAKKPVVEAEKVETPKKSKSVKKETDE